ncbi:MAG TPA: hypothetical protein VFH80_33350 [Solirubrobacteraceae bacterium]|nr:hypothetical protein [Solirubrobacteraceae bacterium]
MNGTQDIDDAAASDPEDTFDPNEAAELLDQTTRSAHHRLDLTSPLLSLLGAAAAVAALGAVWLSVRSQHPYKGPTAAGLAVMYGILVCWIATLATFRRRALSGRSGRTVRQQRAWGAAIVTALVAVSVVQGALHHYGVSNAIVYGVYPVTAQLIVMGAVAAGYQAAVEDWPGFGVAMAVMVVATASAFAGPRGVWLADGIGLAVVVLGYSAAQAWLRRR